MWTEGLSLVSFVVWTEGVMLLTTCDNEIVFLVDLGRKQQVTTVQADIACFINKISIVFFPRVLFSHKSNGVTVVDNLLDIDDPVGDAEYQPPRQGLSSSEEDRSGCEDPIPWPTQLIRGRKHLCDEYEGYRSDCDIGRSRTPRCHSWKKRQHQDQAIKSSLRKGVGCDGKLLR